MALDLNNLDKISNETLGNLYRGLSPDGQSGYEELTAQSLNFLKGFDFGPIVEVLKVTGIVATFIFGALFVWIVFKIRKNMGQKIVELKNMVNPPAAGESKHDAKWKEVLEHLGSLREAEWKFAVIEADNILEEILNSAGFPGETLGEKLKQIDRNQLASIDEIWEAHKLRNVIVHDPDYKIRYNDARVAIGQYEKALRELGVLK